MPLPLRKLRCDIEVPSKGAPLAIPGLIMENVLNLLCGGDVMLGRQVAEAMTAHGLAHPLEPIAPLLRGADVTLVNLECVITSNVLRGRRRHKELYYRAPASAAKALSEAGIDCVTLANNHVLDFDIAGLRDTIEHLDEHGILHAGAGMTLAKAAAPAVVEFHGIRLGIASCCSHQGDFAATLHMPGMNYIDLLDEEAALRSFAEMLAEVTTHDIDWPILAIHWGTTIEKRPPIHHRDIARSAIKQGWKIVVGHGAHVFQGVELYRGWPIIYGAGDLIDDFYADPKLHNEGQLLFGLKLAKHGLRRINLHPIIIDNLQARRAERTEFDDIAHRFQLLCRELGTTVRRRDGELMIEPESGIPEFTP